MKLTQFLILSALGAFCLSAQSEPERGEVSMMNVPEEEIAALQAKRVDRVAQCGDGTCEQPKPRCEQPKPKRERVQVPPECKKEKPPKPKPPECKPPEPKCKPKPPCEAPKPKCERPKPPKCEEKCEKKPKCKTPSRCDKCLENPGSCKSAARKNVEGA